MYNDTVKNTARSYYETNKGYGDLTISYDADKITAIAAKELAAQGVEVDEAELQKEVEQTIKQGDYKQDGHDNFFILLLAAGVITALYFITR